MKFVTNANLAGAKPEGAIPKAVNAEKVEIAKQIESGFWKPSSRFVLITNVPLAATMRERIAETTGVIVPNNQVISWAKKQFDDYVKRLRIVATPDIRHQLLEAQEFESALRSAMETSESN